jgi:opacity protein-like surface antigen
MRKLLMTTVIVMTASAAAPATASADWLFTPFVGVNWGGAANFGDVGDFDDEFEKRGNFGASLAYMGAGAFGFEVDFGWAPNFFENTTGSGNFEFGDNNVTTLMGNLVVGVPIGGQTGPGLRPYASGGVGLIRSQVDDPEGFFNNTSTNDFGFNVGGGITGFFTDNIGIRGDVRYFRSFQDNEPDDEFDLSLSNFHFWRGTVGVTFRF